MVKAPSLDPRINAYRPDLANAALQAYVKAKHYVDPVLRQSLCGVMPLLAEPKPDAERVSEIRCGEFLDVFEIRKDGFAWVQNRSDGYVGYIQAADMLSEEIAALSHRINVLHTFVHVEPSDRSPVVDHLTLGSYVRILSEKNGFAELASGGYAALAHISTTEETTEPDYVFTAGRMLGVPYLWGGRTPLGIDCSAFVQLSLEMAGIDAPRDSDQQCEAFGKSLAGDWKKREWKRGDIVFFKGHVGLMTDSFTLIHANGHHKKVAVEPLEAVVARNNNIIAVGRP